MQKKSKYEIKHERKPISSIWGLLIKLSIIFNMKKFIKIIIERVNLKAKI